RMEHVPAGQRQARFRCVIALALSPDQMQLVDGVCEGEIAFTPRGDGGFGYDPIFVLPQYGRTMAELSAAEKHRISHRGRAAEEARRILQAMIEKGNSY
ncbi:MAG: non-canonical purine NTP pyrophosphatase, partial [Chloroflexota bacterium]